MITIQFRIESPEAFSIRFGGATSQGGGILRIARIHNPYRTHGGGIGKRIAF